MREDAKGAPLIRPARFAKEHSLESVKDRPVRLHGLFFETRPNIISKSSLSEPRIDYVSLHVVQYTLYGLLFATELY